MATKRSTTLKSKTTRRAAKPARPRLNAYARRRCEVAVIGREQGKLERAWEHFNQLWKKAAKDDKDGITDTCNAIAGAMRGNHERASHLQAYSAEGAAFQVMLAYADVEFMADLPEGNERDNRRDRIRRLLYSVLSFMYRGLDVLTFELAQHHYMPWPQRPLFQTERALEKYQQYWDAVTGKLGKAALDAALAGKTGGAS